MNKCFDILGVLYKTIQLFLSSFNVMLGFPALCLRQLSGLLCGLLLNEKVVKVCLFFHDFELNSTEMFFGAAAFATLNISETCRNHVVVILILQNAVGFFENDFSIFSVHCLARFIKNGL